jgi:hypothetical protein
MQSHNRDKRLPEFGGWLLKDRRAGKWGWFLVIYLTGPLVTSEPLGKTEVSTLPFKSLSTGRQSIQVWPVDGK